MESPLEKLSYKQLLRNYQFNSRTLKLFDETYWIGALSASQEIQQQCRALHRETFEVQQQLQIELAHRTLVRIRRRLTTVKDGFCQDDSDCTHEEGAH